jgi:CDP-diacylglycerol--glycerol-3-phosphate 3-phosphatidyltransferase
MSPAAGVGSGWSLGVFLFFVALSLTDKLDGYLARSRNEVTTFGKFLDPIADKLVVVVALCFLLERGEVSSWVLLVIVAREFLVSGLRMVVASSGTVIAASPLGKGKPLLRWLPSPRCSLPWRFPRVALRRPLSCSDRCSWSQRLY